MYEILLCTLYAAAKKMVRNNNQNFAVKQNVSAVARPHSRRHRAGCSTGDA